MRHHRKQLRAPGFDYSTPGTYWVTICVHNMECRFGHVEHGLVHLNDAGRMVLRHWLEIPDQFEAVALDAFVIMPNHLHGIVFLHDTGHIPRVSLSTALGSFKSRVTVEYSAGVRSGMYPPYDRTLWQRSFSDRIVQSDRRLDTLRRYVEGNPGRWQDKQDGRSRKS
jgi:REP element-mobilizing transposase RayT